ncbi:Phosphodiesterase [Fasciolopsis buskii]|uniref:Phosphodiesterase n=1 Tax=Fasciolopsis buskii TaxID=27845 RepID=A0A8E0VI29_9TREM|nr:Phosphodiesterase [Fasciolopsis buski]
MWCMLCCQAQTKEDNKCPEQENLRPLEYHKADSIEPNARISPTNGVHMDSIKEALHAENGLVTESAPFGENRRHDAGKLNLGSNHISAVPNSTPGPISGDAVKTAILATASVPLDATSSLVTTSVTVITAATTVTLPSTTVAEITQSGKRPQRSHRTEGMSVSFSTPDERVMHDWSTSHPSATGRPIWTLKDIFDSPYTYEPTTSVRSDELIISLSHSEENQTDSNAAHPTEGTYRPDKLPYSNSDVRLTRRHTRPGSLYHPHATFFLPRISTDPSTGSGPLDHTYVGDDKPFPIRRGSMIVRSGRTTTSSTNVQSSAVEQTAVGAPATGVEGFIVTPFAQVLVSMQRIRSAFIRLTATQSSNR